MIRSQCIATLEDSSGYWDMIIIGGGATGLGCLVDAAARGYKAILLEQHDFSKGTSSRSTKLIHGGVRYLQQGNVSLVLEALHERGLLMQNAPHLVSHQAFIVPNYEWWDGPFYGVGLKVYDLLAGKLGLGPSKWLSKKEVLGHIPNLETEKLRGGIMYYDGQFDDSRLAVNLAQTAVDLGGAALNYMKVTALTHAGRMLDGVEAKDMITGREYRIYGRVVVNATGVFSDEILKMDNPDASPIITPSQGVHLILDGHFLSGDAAIMVPQTDDGRVLFAVPWHDKALVGTTDTFVEGPSLEPCALDEEIDFILEHAAKYMTQDPDRSDVRSVFAGLRPLVGVAENKNTAAISRDHYLVVSDAGLVTITGGKWTTYRKMAEDTINQAALIAGLPLEDCRTKHHRIHGWLKNFDPKDPMHYYGSDMPSIRTLMEDAPALKEKLHERLPYVKAEVVWAVRNEMALTLEDVLARRTRSLLLDAQASMEAATETARLMAEEMGYDEDWITSQISGYKAVAGNYLLR